MIRVAKLQFYTEKVNQLDNAHDAATAGTTTTTMAYIASAKSERDEESQPKAASRQACQSSSQQVHNDAADEQRTTDALLLGSCHIILAVRRLQSFNREKKCAKVVRKRMRKCSIGGKKCSLLSVVRLPTANGMFTRRHFSAPALRFICLSCANKQTKKTSSQQLVASRYSKHRRRKR